jgi:hypothetical protein
MIATKRRLQYCSEHYYVALDLYNRYKEATSKALETFNNKDLKYSIELRLQYDTEFIGGDDGAHKAFVELLQKLLDYPLYKRKYIFDKLLLQFNKIYIE